MVLLSVCVSTARLFHQAFISFRKYALESTQLPADLHIILSDISYGAGLITLTKSMFLLIMDKTHSSPGFLLNSLQYR